MPTCSEEANASRHNSAYSFLKKSHRCSVSDAFFLYHHVKLVKEWHSKHAEEIEVFYLPAYSPELNPDVYLNCDLKAGVHSKYSVRSKTQLKVKVLSHKMKIPTEPQCSFWNTLSVDSKKC